MARLFGDYIKYLSFIDKVPIFNKESFIETKNAKFREFYDQLTDTQSFLFFLQQDLKESYPIFYKLSQNQNDIENLANKDLKDTKKFILDRKRTSTTFIELTGANCIQNYDSKSIKSSFRSLNDEDTLIDSFDSELLDISTLFDSKANVEYKEIYLIVPYFDTDKKTSNLDLNFKDDSSTQNSNNKLKIIIENQKEFDYPKKLAKYYQYNLPYQESKNKAQKINKGIVENVHIHPQYDEDPQVLGIIILIQK